MPFTPVRAPPENDSEAQPGARAPADTLKLGPRARAGKILCLSVREADGLRRVPLPASGEMIVGRGPEADLRLDVPSVSRRHARIVGGDVPAIEDLGSTNGSWVNGAPLAPGRFSVLGEGTAVKLGDVVAVVEHVEHEAQVAPEMPDEVIVVSPSMRAIHERIRLFARGHTPILILGETGTGKEVYSSILVRMSPRASKPFLRLNCAALPGDMVESELFGYERGAFTGAVSAKPGLLESAHGGTVLLDEAGELSLRTQAKLLRALESGEILRLGAVKPRKVDVRLLAATNRDLGKMVQEQGFRADLYYRLAGAEIVLPPLRERMEDLESLAAALLAQATRSQGLSSKRLSDSALAKLKSHRWPGNIRELKSALERAVLVAEGAVVSAEHVTFVGWGPSLPPAPLPSAPTGAMEISVQGRARGDAKRPVSVQVVSAPPIDLASVAETVAPPPADDFYHLKRERERASILAALEQCGGNQTQAAIQLGMPRRTLVKRLTEYGIRVPRRSEPTNDE